MKRILVIEDEDALREGIVDMLEGGGYYAYDAADGLAGVRLAREHLPDLIICDIMMPDLDGYGVLEELRDDPATAAIPFMFLTAKAQMTDVRAGMELGADDYLTKPFARDQLLKAIETRLAKRASVATRFEQKLDDLRSNIILSLPHELRTPLTGIYGGAMLLRDQLATLSQADLRELAQMMFESAERLNRLVTNYILYVEMELAATQPAMIEAMQASRAVPVERLIRETALNIAQQAGRQADLTLELQAVTARIADLHLQKLTAELIDNAFKYSQPGTPVQVKVRGNSHVTQVDISDRGRGMTAQHILDLGAYMQFDRKIHEQQGSGLGLAIAKRLAGLYGGQLTIESVPGRGTTVHVVLPA